MCEAVRMGVENRVTGCRIVDTWIRFVSATTSTERELSAGRRIGWPDQPPEILDGGDRLERTGDDLTGARTVGFVRQPCLEELGVGENDAELVVQTVKHPRELEGAHAWQRGGQWSGRNGQLVSSG